MLTPTVSKNIDERERGRESEGKKKKRDKGTREEIWVSERGRGSSPSGSSPSFSSPSYFSPHSSPPDSTPSHFSPPLTREGGREGKEN